MNITSFSLKQIVYVCAGSCLMLIIGFSNYGKLARYSWGLYAATIILLSFVLLFGPVMNGRSGYVNWGPVQLNVPALSPYLLLIAIAGIWSTSPKIAPYESSAQALLRKSWTNVGIVWLPSLLILATHTIANFILFFIGCLTMLLVRKKGAIFVAHCSVLAALVGLFLLKLSYQTDRLYAFTHPSADLQGMNYQVNQSIIAIQSAGWLGHGFGAPLHALPELQAEMMFPFLIHCFGWGAGIALVIMVTLFVQQMVGVSRKASDPYGKALVCGLLALLITNYIWSILMSMGLAPNSAFQLPFISYTGSLVIFQFIAVGLMLSVYRRKDLGTRQFT